MKKKAEKMKKERKIKALIEKKEAEKQILKAEESVETTNGLLANNYGRLASRPNDPTVWKERCSLVGDYLSIWEKKLDLVRDFAEEHLVNNDSFWTSRFTSIGKIRSEFANKELEHTKSFLPEGTNNYQAWSYREWIIQNINKCLWKSELQYCHEILEKDKSNVSVWVQMCRAAAQLNHKMGEKSRLKEVDYAKVAIVAHPGNEGPWTYLKVLYVEHKETLYKNPILECIFVDVLVEAACYVKLVRELDPGCNAAFYSVAANRGCVHAMNLIVDLMIYGYEMNQNKRLVNALNVLFAYPRRHYTVCAAMFSVDACRVRYCHKYRGFHWFRDLSLFNNRGLQFEMEAQDDTKCDDVEALEQDLMSDIRRCVGKDKVTENDAMEELEKTTENMKVDAYNRRAWFQRQCVIQTFVGDWKDDQEIQLCDDILEKDACNSFAWDHRFFVVTRSVQKFDADNDEEMRNFKVQSQSVLQQETKFATKFIEDEPGNPFPWTHIIGVHTAYYLFSQLGKNEKVREAILQVLVKNKDVIVAKGDVMVNASGIINAMNMLLDLVVNNNYDIWKDEAFKGIMNELCPDSCFEYKCNTLDRIVFLLRRMVEAFSEVDLLWENVADQLLTGT